MYYCGIDVAKHTHTLLVIDEQGNTVQPAITVRNDQNGMTELKEALLPFKSELHVGLEATGHYWLSVYDVLCHEEYQLTVINPIQVHAYHRLDVRKRKTDRIDAFWIAQYLRFAHPSPTTLQLPDILQLRELTRFRFHLTQLIGDCKRKIICILDRIFPEYETLFSNVFLQTSRQLLQVAVSAEEFADFDLGELETLLQTSSRGRFGRDKADEIRSAARNSIAVSFLSDALKVETRCLLQQMDLLQEQRSAIDAHIERFMSRIPQHITSIPGIGPTTAAMLLAEIGDISRFPGPENLVAYAGIDPTVFQTGEFDGQRMHMSKRGSHYLRYALWQAATASLLHNNELESYYRKKRSEGKPHGVAMGALCHKLLGRVYIVLKENRPYVVH